MRLCALLGIHSRRALKQLLTHRDYLDWLALYREDPWDQDRSDLRAGVIASAALAPYSKPGRQSRPVDFMLYAKTRRKEMDEADMKKVISTLTPRWGAKTAEKESPYGN
jgi:hypothetical protein